MSIDWDIEQIEWVESFSTPSTKSFDLMIPLRDGGVEMRGIGKVDVFEGCSGDYDTRINILVGDTRISRVISVGFVEVDLAIG